MAGHSHHHHHHGRDAIGRILLWTMLFNLVIPICQLAGGWLAGSTALMSDAVHNISDFTGLAVAFAAHRMAGRPPSGGYTYGFQRAEIMAAGVNAALLVGACVFIGLEAGHRLLDPRPVAGGLVAVLAGVGVVGNGVSAWLLHRGSRGDLNMRGAYLHMMTDLLVSVAVLANGLVLMARPWYWLDPLLSALIVVLVLRGVWDVLRRAARILMEGAPEDLDLDRVRQAMEAVDGVSGVHHLHAWNLGSQDVSLTCHVVVGFRPLAETASMAAELRRRLGELGVGHATFEFEAEPCGDPACGHGRASQPEPDNHAE